MMVNSVFSNWTRYRKRLLLLIFVAALSLRIAAVLNLPQYLQKPGADALDYDTIAVNLASGNGYSMDPEKGPTSLRAPLYPLFLASIYWAFGHNYVAVRVIQSIMGALLCVIIYYIGRKIFDERIGLLSALILVFYQPYISYAFYGGPGFLYSENLFNILYGLFVLFLINGFFVNLKMKGAVISGIFLGLLALTRPFNAFFPLFLSGLLICRYPLKLALRSTLVMCAVFALTISPWAFRNYLVHRALVPFSTMGGGALLNSNNPYAKGSSFGDLSRIFTNEEMKQISRMNEVEQDKFYKNTAIKFIAADYKRMPKLLLKKVLCLWDVFQTHYNNGMQRVYNIWYSIILMFAIIGIIKAVRTGLNVSAALLLLSFLYASFMVMIFSGDTRHRYPLEPYLIIFAGLGIFTIWGRFKNKSLSLAIIGVIMALNLLFYVMAVPILNWVRNNLAFIL